MSVFIGGVLWSTCCGYSGETVYEVLARPSSVITSKIYLCSKSRCRIAGGKSMFMSAIAYGQQLAGMLCLGVVRSSNTA